MTAKLSLVEKSIASTSTAVTAAHRDTSTGLTVVSEDIRSVREAVDAGHQRTNAELALASGEIYSRMEALESLVLGQHEQTRRHLISQQVFQVSSAPILPAPAILREACDVVSAARMPRRPGVTSSRCGCDLRERTRPVAVARGIPAVGALVYEHYEVSRHFPSCPFYAMSSRAQRRVRAQLSAGVWRRFSVWVQASFTCTTGAGSFSISPHLSFRTTVKDSPAQTEIDDAFPMWLSPDRRTSVAKRVATAERRILKMFQTGEASPHDRFPDGSTLLHACCSIP